MSIRDVPREQLELGVTRLRIDGCNRSRSDGVFAGFNRARVAEVLVKFPEYSDVFTYSVDDCEVAE